MWTYLTSSGCSEHHAYYMWPDAVWSAVGQSHIHLLLMAQTTMCDVWLCSETSGISIAKTTRTFTWKQEAPKQSSKALSNAITVHAITCNHRIWCIVDVPLLQSSGMLDQNVSVTFGIHTLRFECSSCLQMTVIVQGKTLPRQSQAIRIFPKL